MPQAIAAFFVKLGLSAFAAAVAAAVVQVAITVGLNALISAVFGRGSPKPSDGQQNVNEAVGSRRRHYGIVHTGGQRSFLDSANGRLGIVVTLGTGKEGTILEHRINDKVVTVVGGTVTEASYHNAIHIYTRSGDPDQTAIGELTTRFPQWTSDHRQRGCAHAAIICDPVKQEHFSEVFNGQMPTYTQVRWGVGVYDPRKDSTAVVGYDAEGAPIYGDGAHRLDNDSTWEPSDNAPLVIADYFAHPDGYGGGFDNVNWTNIAQEADHADETVTTVTSEVIARWRLWASYSLANTERRRVMGELLKACDGYSWQDAEGRFNLMVGRFVEPTVVITDTHILGMTPTLGPPSAQRVNAIKALYTEAAIGYREQESATYAGPDVEDDPNNDPQALEVYYAPHHNQGVRVAKLVYSRLGDDRWHIPALLNLYGLNLIGERFCRLVSDQLGVDGVFMVNGLRLHLGDMRVEAMLDEVKAIDWDFDAAEEEGTPPLAPDAPAPPPPLAAPTGLTLDGVQIVLGDVNAVAIAASWDDPGRPDLTHEAQYSPSGADEWVSMVIDQELRTARSGPVDSGIEFEVRVRALTITGRASAWTTGTVTPTANPATLAPPVFLSVTGDVGEAEVRLRLSTGASFAFARLYHATSSDFGGATQVGTDIEGALGEVKVITDTGLSPGTEYYWARAFDDGGTPSALAGPVSVTIS